jgi:hypothetical protein
MADPDPDPKLMTTRDPEKTTTRFWFQHVLGLKPAGAAAIKAISTGSEIPAFHIGSFFF